MSRHQHYRWSIVESSIEPGDTVNAEFTLNYNENSTANATNVTFTVDLDNALSGMTTSTASQTDVCGSGSTFSGTNTLTLTGGSLIPDSTCTFSVALQIPSDAIPSIITMDSSAVSATTSGMSVTSATASDTLLISGLSLTQEFVGNPALPGAIITSRYTISNHADALAATAMSFNHNYQLIIPTFTAIALPTTPCNGSSTLSGTTNLIFSAGELQPGENCTFDVSLQVPLGASEGVFNSATSSMSATVNGNNTANSAANSTLIIEQLTVLLSTNEASPTSITPFSVAVNFSRNVTGLTASDFVVGNGTASNLQGSDASYTVDITPTTDGSVTIDLPANVVNDAVDNSVQNPGASQLTIVYASVPATATPSLTISAPSVSATDTGPVIYTVTYANAAEVNLTSSSITLNNGGTAATATVTVTDGSSTTPTVTLSDISGDGTLGVSIAAGTARNGTEVAASAGPSNTFVVDNTSPSLNAYSPSQNAVDESVSTTQLILTFSETVIANTSNNLIEIKNVADNAVIYSFAADSSAVVITGNTATVSFSPALPESRALYVTVAANAFKDALGHVFAGINDDSTWRFTIINRPPVISGAPAAQVAEDSNYSFTPAVSDVDVYDTAAFSIVNAPSWASFDTTTGALTGTPDNDDVGVTSGIVITVTDSAGAQVSLAAFSITVGNINDAPVITGTPAAQVDEDSNYSFTPSVSDVDAGDTAAFSIVNAPSWASFDTTTGTLTGTPDNDDVGVTSGIVITVTDSASAQASLAAFSITVGNTNDAPVITGTPAAQVDEDSNYSFTPSVSDVDAGDTAAFSVVNAPSWASFDTTTGALTGTPDNDDVGVTSGIVITVTDSASAQASLAAFSITVGNINDAPVITGTPAAQVDEDSNYSFTPSVNDVDAGDTAAFSIVNAPSWASFDTTTGALTGTPFNADVNVTSGIVITVTDSAGAQASLAAFSITVSNTNDAPVITGTPAAQVDEDSNYSFTPAVSDVDAGDTAAFSIVNAPSWASFDTTTGALTGTPVNADVNVTSGIVITVTDSAGAQASLAAFSITVSNTNDAPVAVADSYTLNEGDSLSTTGVLINDSDIDAGSVITAVLVSNVNHGSLMLNSDGSFTYTHDDSETISDNFTYKANDTLLDSNTVTVTLSINPENDAPLANDDTLSVNEDAVVQIAVLDNDIDSEGFLLASSTSIMTAPSNGATRLNTANGVITYTPDVNFNGSDSFTYQVSDGEGVTSNVATVSIVVVAVNDAPVMSNDIQTTNEDVAILIDVLANDTDVDGDTVSTVIIDTQPNNGSVTIENDKVNYQPNSNFEGTDSFTYYAQDSTGAIGNAATVTINITGDNDLPRAVNDSAITDEDTPVSIDVLANDSDVDGGIDSRTVSMIGAPSQGSININSVNGAITYTPSANFNGEDSFNYVVKDVDDGTSNEATVSITINPINDAPVANDDSVTNLFEDISYPINVLGNDSDAENGIDITTVSIDREPNEGLVSVDPTTGVISYTPGANYFGSDSFTYRVSDDGSGSAGSMINPKQSNVAKVNLTIASVNDLPVANDDIYSVAEDSNTNSFNILNNDNDIDGSLDETTVTLLQSVTNGSLSINNDGTVDYVPSANYVGSDSFIYTVNDNEGGISNTALVNITVIAANDAPVALNDSVSVNEDSSTNIDVLANDSDSDGDTLTVTSAAAVNGTVSINSNGSLNYSPNVNFNGTDTITYGISDGNGGNASATVSVTVSAANDAPVAVNDSARVNEDSSTNIEVLANDSDSDGDTLTVTSAAAVNGTVSINSNGSLNYSPNVNFNGTDTITYGISDGNGGNASATVSVTVAALNDAPVMSGTPATQVAEGDNYSFTPTVSDVDVDDVTTFSISGNPQWMLFNNKTGAVSGTPIQADVDVTSDVTITVNDNSGADNAKDSISFNVTVSNINQAPEAVADSFVFDLNNKNTYTLNVLSNDTDVDGDALSITGASASIGSVTIDGASLIFMTQAGFVGQVEITYAITDGNDTFVTTTVDVLIEGDSNQSAPIITAPAAVEVDAIGLYTRVELGVATATNRFGQPIPVSLVASQPLFRPGNNIVYWQAEDSQGLKSVASQSVVVYPLISMSQDKTSVEGTSHDVRVFLNGPSPIYPVIIGYSVSGSADDNDHNLISGEIVIESGEVGSISFDVLADDMSEESETLTITLDDTLNLGAKPAHTLTIVEQNIAPQVTYSVTQDNEQRFLIENNAGEVVIQTEVFDSNTPDTHQYQWLNSESYLVDVDNDETTYTFDTTGLTAGIQTLTLVVTDNGDKPLSTETNIYLEITDTLAVLTDIDSDGDLIPDNEEGFGDDDFDGIPNYLDVPSACNVMPQQVSESQAFLVEGEAGVCLRKGATVANNKSGGLELSPDEVPNDEETLNVGGLFDFIAYGLPQAGQSFNLVLPQLQPIPANALYRKLTPINGWVDFVVDVNNQVSSSQGYYGFCLPPGDASWSIGLNEGHWCVQLTIEDGGPNDDDGLANGSINDPGGVSVMLTDNTPPEAQADIVRVKGNESLIIDVLSNDSDADGDMLNISTVNVTFGVVTITFDNQLSYQSQTDFIGEDSLVYTVSDGNGGSASATVNITVYGNDGPIAVNDSANTDDRTPIDINVLGNDSDTDGDNLTVVSATVDEGSVAINGDNTLTYTPVSGFVGAATIIYIVDDGQGAQATAQAIVNVKTYISITVNKKSSGGSLTLMLFALMGLVLYRLLCQRLHQQLCQPQRAQQPFVNRCDAFIASYL